MSAPASSNDSLEDIFRRAEAALFDRAPTPQAARPEPEATADAPAPQPPAGKGRILETLNEVDPLASMMAERVQATRRGRKPGSKNKPKPVILDSSHAGEARTEHGALAAKSFGDVRGSLDTVESGDALARTQIDTPDEVPHESPVAVVRQSDYPDLTAAATAPALRPRGLIRGRYVTGSEPKPGERWKRRLRTGR